jgi:HK97 family phage major capsid protein
MNLAERIKAAQEALLAKKDLLTIELKKLDDTPDDDTVLATVDQLSADVEQQTKSLESLQRAEKAMAERAAAAPAIVTSTGKADDSKELWVKEAVVAFMAHCQRKNHDQVRQELYPTNKALEAVMVHKTAVPLATTFTPGWAAELVQSDVQGFINLLSPVSVVAALGSRALSLNFGGFDSISIPRRGARGAHGANMGGAWVGEGGAIPLGQMSVGASKLNRYKMGIISTFSKELAQRATPQIEAIIRQAILDDTAIELDAAFLSDNAVIAGVRPAGIAQGVTPTGGTAGGGVDAVVADIKAAITALTTAGLGTRPVLIMNTANAMSVGFMQSALGEMMFQSELAAGRLLGLEVIKSLNVPVNTAYVIDASTLALAVDATTFDVSDVATVVEVNSDNTAPTMNVDAAGALGGAGKVGTVPQNGGISANGLPTGAGTTGAVARSLWQTHSVGVKAIQPVSWGLMQPGGVFQLNSLSW